MIEITIPVEPIAKGRPRFTRQGHAYTPKKTRDYETLIKTYLLKEKLKPIEKEKALYLEIIFVRPVPKSWSKKKKQQALDGIVRPTTRPDLDNYEKAIMDACNGVLYEDDSQVVVKKTKKIYGEEPRSIIRLEEIKE